MPSASFIAAKVSWSVLKAPLETRGGVFAASEAKFGAAGEDVLDVGEHAGATYVSNRTFHLSLASSPDLFANVSKELGTLVVVWGYETISGSYTLLVVRNGELIRYFSRITAEKRPLDMGAPLPTEEQSPLASVDGLTAAVRHLGFDVPGWYSRAVRRRITFADDQRRFSTEEGPLGLRRALAQHDATYAIPRDQWHKDFTVELTPATGGDAVFHAPDGKSYGLRMTKKPWHRRFREKVALDPESRSINWSRVLFAGALVVLTIVLFGWKKTLERSTLIPAIVAAIVAPLILRLVKKT